MDAFVVRLPRDKRHPATPTPSTTATSNGNGSDSKRSSLRRFHVDDDEEDNDNDPISEFDDNDTRTHVQAQTMDDFVVRTIISKDHSNATDNRNGNDSDDDNNTHTSRVVCNWRSARRMRRHNAGVLQSQYELTGRLPVCMRAHIARAVASSLHLVCCYPYHPTVQMTRFTWYSYHVHFRRCHRRVHHLDHGNTPCNDVPVVNDILSKREWVIVNG
jgi:hypothetical protein